MDNARAWRIASWIAYILGLPAWVFLFVGKHDWIAAALEASGAPAMMLGLVSSVRGQSRASPKWLDFLALICIILGLGYSLYDFGGLNKVSQWLEIGLVAGFLIGTYQIAKDKSSGYLWFVVMHICCGWLMFAQGYRWLFVQQLVSLGFIVDAYITSRRKIEWR